MSKHSIAVIKGDGIGIDVVDEALKVLHALSSKHGIEWNFVEFPWSSDYYFEHGEMMPSNGVEQLRCFDAIFLGAVGHPDVQDHITLNGLLLPIRRAFDQYACVRPSILLPGVESPLKNVKPYDIDLIVVRENTEGEYANVGGFQYQNFPGEVAVQSSVFTRKGCERVIRYAQGYGMVLWDRTFDAVKEEYPDISTDSLLIDAACMDFIRRPEKFDVVVASNLFGDILTDIGAIITGSMGLASSANLDPTRTNPSMFEPTHGSAPDIAGMGIANPMAQILTAALMLDHLGENSSADSVRSAVEELLKQGETLTPDLGGSSTTTAVGDAIAALVT